MVGWLGSWVVGLVRHSLGDGGWLGGYTFDDERSLVAKAVETAHRQGLAAANEPQRTRRRCLNGARRFGRIEQLAQPEIPGRRIDDMDKLPCIITGHPALVKDETAVHDKTRGRRPHLRQKDRVADGQPGCIRRCERKCGILRHCGKNNRAYRLMREVKVSPIIY